MKNAERTIIGIFAFCAIAISCQAVSAQNKIEEFSGGNIIGFNGPKVTTANFYLRINGWTSDEQANQNLSILENDGQDKLLSAINKENVGSLSVNNGLAQTINVARETQIDGKQRIFVVFERWMHFAELRGGYRSVDYPFGVIEPLIDPATGKGGGTFIAAAQVRWAKDKKTNWST